MPRGSLTASPVRFLPKSIPIILSILDTKLRKIMSKASKINILAAVAVFIASFLLIAFTPLHDLIPGYPDAEFRRQQAVEKMKMDSLERSIYRWELYSENLRKVVFGEKPIQIDSLIRQAQIDFKDGKTVAPANTDSLLRAFVKEKEMFGISDDKPQYSIEDAHFFKPLTGTVSRHFEMAQHPYIDITAPEGSPVKSVLDGSVLFTDWNEADGWIIILQHENGIISIYKHNQKLLKAVSDNVSAGTSIAILGSSASVRQESAHLHFELWQDGTPLDPSLYINF